MIPKLFFGSFVPTMADNSVQPEKLLADFPEFFTYASVRGIATLEAFYSKLTGKEAKWGNTGGIGRGSKDEIPNIIFVVLMIIGFVRSVTSPLISGTKLVPSSGQSAGGVIPRMSITVGLRSNVAAGYSVCVLRFTMPGHSSRPGSRMPPSVRSRFLPRRPFVLPGLSPAGCPW